LKKELSLLLFGLLVAWGAAGAKTPDGKPPSQETVCDGQTGAAFGLCNAYCEAMDCDSPNHRASDTACARVKRNYERQTGHPLPCEIECPCVKQFPLFADLASGAATALQCIADAQVISVATPAGTFAIVNGGTMPPFCSVNLEPPLLELTQQEVTACRDLLRKAAAAQSVTCVAPE
jgi:hypothetical protein